MHKKEKHIFSKLFKNRGSKTDRIVYFTKSESGVRDGQLIIEKSVTESGQEIYNIDWIPEKHYENTLPKDKPIEEVHTLVDGLIKDMKDKTSRAFRYDSR